MSRTFGAITSRARHSLYGLFLYCYEYRTCDLFFLQNTYFLKGTCIILASRPKKTRVSVAGPALQRPQRGFTMERIGRTAAHLRPSAPTSVVLTTSLDAAATAAGGAGHGPLPAATHDELGLDLEPLYACCEELVARGATPGVCVAVARHGKLLPPRAFGFAGPDAGADVNQGLEAGAELQPSSIFLVASVTKPVVATAVVQLVEQGRLDLDAPVSSLIPAFASSAGGSDPFRGDARAAVTVRHLLTHTSGLPDAVSEGPRVCSYTPLICRRAASMHGY
eukprot:COSAG06_NODE_238_length_19422_cov_16.417741_23_plen_279_part_00